MSTWAAWCGRATRRVHNRYVKPPTRSDWMKQLQLQLLRAIATSTAFRETRDPRPRLAPVPDSTACGSAVSASRFVVTYVKTIVYNRSYSAVHVTDFTEILGELWVAFARVPAVSVSLLQSSKSVVYVRIPNPFKIYIYLQIYELQ